MMAGGLFILQAGYAQNLKQAIGYTENELFEDASQVFHKLISEKPTDPQLYYYMGENMYESERLDSALFYFEKGITQDANFALNHVGKGKVLLSRGDDAGAKSLFEKAISLSASKDGKVFLAIAEAYVATEYKDMTFAIQTITMAEKLDPRNPDVFLVKGDAILLKDNDGSAALTSYEAAMNMEPNSPKPHIHMGALYERGRAYEEAFKEYNQAVTLDSTFAPSYRKLGDLYYKYNDYKKAKDNYQKYLKLAKNSMSAQKRYAKFLYLSKEYQPAIDEINKILAVDPNDIVLYRIRAYCYCELKQYSNGLPDIERFFTDQPNSGLKLLAEDHKYRGKILAGLGKDSLAVTDLGKAVEMDSTLLDVYGDLAGSFLKLKQYDNAIQTLNRKMKLVKEPTSGDYFKLGQTYYSKAGAIKDSVTFAKSDSLFNIVLTKQPDFLMGWVFRARANAGMDPETKYGVAKPFYEKVLELGSVDVEKNKKVLVEANYYLAYLHYLQKDKAKATEYVDKLLVLDPTNPNAPNLKKLIDKLP